MLLQDGGLEPQAPVDYPGNQLLFLIFLGSVILLIAVIIYFRGDLLERRDSEGPSPDIEEKDIQRLIDDAGRKPWQ